MKIYINGRFITKKITGVQRYAWEVLIAFDNLLNQNNDLLENTYYVLVPRSFEINHRFKNLKIKKVGFLKGHFWEQFELPLYTIGWPLLNLCNIGPILKKKQAVVIHDAMIYMPNNHLSPQFKIIYKIMTNFLTKISDKIITVSNCSKMDILKYTKMNEKRLEVIYEGCNHIKRFKIEENNKLSDLLRSPYILAVSSVNPNKNFKGIVQALEFMRNRDINVVIAGGTNSKLFKNEYFEQKKNVYRLGYVSDSELATLYKYATCFVYPSFYEGFGIPPLEAMTMGCAVVVSNRGSLSEVCGDSVLYCNPEDPKDIAKKIDLLLSDETKRNEYVKLGLERSSHFTWEKCAISVFNSVLSLEKEVR